MSGFSKFFTKERIIILVAFLILAWALYSYSGSKSMIVDRMSDGSVPAPSAPSVAAPAQAPAPAQAGPAPAPSAASQAGPAGYTAKAGANPADLLPKDANSQWAALNPTSMNQGDILMPDLLQAGYHTNVSIIGVAQTNRNPTYDIRSEQPNPQSKWPILQSTIDPDPFRASRALDGLCA